MLVIIMVLMFECDLAKYGRLNCHARSAHAWSHLRLARLKLQFAQGRDFQVEDGFSSGRGCSLRWDKLDYYQPLVRSGPELLLE